MIRTVRMIAVSLSVAVSAIGAASADSPRFHPAPGTMPVIGRYVVTLADSVAEELTESSVRGMAMSYGGQLEPSPSSNLRQFAISMAPARARTLSADPRVREVAEIPQSDESGSGAPSVPSRADLSRHGFVPAPQDSSSSGTYLYDGAGNIKAIGSDTFVYDVVGRLKQAIVQGSQQNYDYDAFGNRILTTRASNAAGCVGGCEAPSTVFGQSNHLTGASYDVAGNVISVNGAAYAYDGTSMVTRATAGSDDRMFIYAADDERIGVRNGFSWTWTVRDLSGKVLRELTSLETQASPLVLTNHTWSKDYVWRDGLLLASVFPTTPGTITPTTTYHYHLDHLGTPRLITDNAGVLVAKHTYYPFGAEMDITPHESTTERMKFTGHERDVVAANNATVDYMHARYYNGNLGRFLSVDPTQKTKSGVRLPQLWNRYSYVSNNPLHYVDPTGAVAELPSNCADQKTTCKEIRDLRNGVPLELRMFIRSTTVNGKTVIDSRYMRMMRGATSQNFQALSLVANNPLVTHITSSQDIYSAIPTRDDSFGTSLASKSANGLTLISGSSSPNDDNYIYVNGGLGPRGAAGVLAHELRHAKLFLLGLPYDHWEEQPDGTFIKDPNSMANVETRSAKEEAYRDYDQSIPPL